MPNPHQHAHTGPPNGGIPPGSLAFLPPQPTTPSPPHRPGGRFHSQKVEHEGVRALFPLDTAVFHIMNSAFMTRSPGGYMQPWEFPTGLTVSDLCRALGVTGGITECHDMGNGKWMKSQTIYPLDARAGKRLEEVGWTAGRGMNSKPVWIEVVD